MTTNQKVLIVVTKSNFGGAQRYCLDLSRELKKRGINAAVAHGVDPDGKRGKLTTLLFANDIRSIPLASLGRDIHPMRDVVAFKELRALFALERPHVVHLNSSKAGGLGALAARVSRVPRIVFTLHGFPGDEARSALSRTLITLATWLTILLSHVTITIHRRDYERMRALPFARRKVVLVRNGIETPTFLSRSEARAELRTLAPALPPDCTLVGSIGELHVNKAYDTLIRALSKVDAHLVLIGDGSERSRLTGLAESEQVKDRLHIVGFVPDAARYLRALDCFVLPSQKEGLPYVLLEAGCAYVPVVATHVGGIPDVIVNDFTGILVPPGKPDQLASAINRVLSDATLARSLSEELLKRVRGSFSLETMVDKTIATYGLRSSASNTA